MTDSKDPMADPAFHQLVGATDIGQLAVKDWLAKHAEHDPLQGALADREKVIGAQPVGRKVLADERKA